MSSRVSSYLIVALLSSATMGCSSDFMRMENPFTNPFNGKGLQTSSTRMTPEQSLRNQQASFQATPRNQSFAQRNPVDNDVVTGSVRKRVSEVKSYPLNDVPSSVSNAWKGQGAIKSPINLPRLPKEMQAKQGSGGWSPIGGTTINVKSGDSVKSVSERYGVPASAVAMANGVDSGAVFSSSRQLVVPTYSLNNKGVTSKKPLSEEREITPEKTVKITGLKSQKVKVATNEKYAKEVLQAKKPKTSAQSYAKHMREHIVAPGDSLLALSNRYNIPRQELARANKMDDWGQLKIGSKLTIPAQGTMLAKAKPTVVVAKATKLRDDPIVTGSISSPKKIATAKPVLEAKPKAVKAEDKAVRDETLSHEKELRFRWPLREAKVISNYGEELNSAKNEGINFSAPEGTSIMAAEDGEIVYAGNGMKEPSLKAYGNLILIRHADKFVTAYAHARDFSVKVGDRVKKGQVIGTVGQTGSVATPQLHFEVRQGKSSIDPETKIKA